MADKRTKAQSAKCELLDSIHQTLARQNCELQKIISDMQAIEVIQKCTVSLSDNIEINGLVKMAEDNRALIETLIPKVVEHSEKHPAAVDRDSGIDSLQDVEIEEFAMAERPYAGNSTINGTLGESRC